MGRRPLPGEGGEDTFLQAWSRLEAYAKAHGDGLAKTLAALGVRGGDRSMPRTPSPADIETTARQRARSAGLNVHDVKLPEGYTGAVACAGPAPRVRLLPSERRALHACCPRRRPRRRVDAYPVDRGQASGQNKANSERSAAWLAHQSGGLGVGSSNLPAPTNISIT